MKLEGGCYCGEVRYAADVQRLLIARGDGGRLGPVL